MSRTLNAVFTGLVVAFVIAARLPAQDCVPASPDLLSWWRGEGAGSDAMGTADGLLNAGVSFVPGKVGLAFGFDGTSGFIDIGNPANNYDYYSADSVSWDCWFRTASGGPLLNKANATGTLDVLFTYVAVSGNLHTSVLTDSNFTQSLGSTQSYNDGVFHHLAVMIDGTLGTLTMIVDGGAEVVQAVFPPGSSFARLGTTLVLGKSFPSSHFQGEIDEIAIHRRALSLAEVAALHAAGSSGRCLAPLPPRIGRVPSGIPGVNVPVGFDARIFRSGGKPLEIAVEPTGNVLLSSNCSSCGIVRLAPDGTYLGQSPSLSDPDGVAIDPLDGRAYATAKTWIGRLAEPLGDPVAVFATGFNNLNFLKVDSQGVFYAVEDNGWIRRVESNGSTGQIIEPPVATLPPWPLIEIGPADEILTTHFGAFKSIDPATGTLTVRAPTTDLNGGLACTTGGPLGAYTYVAARNTGRIARIAADGNVQTWATGITSLLDIAADSTGGLLVADPLATDRTIQIFPLVEPAAAERYGVGCPGTGGLVPQLDPVGLPQFGNPTFSLLLSDARPFSLAPFGVSLGPDEVALGGGCSLYVLQPLLFFNLYTDQLGQAAFTFAMPPDTPPFPGLYAYFQAAVFDPQGSVGLLSFSNGVWIRFGE